MIKKVCIFSIVVYICNKSIRIFSKIQQLLSYGKQKNQIIYGPMYALIG